MRSSICPSLYTKPFQSVHGLRRLLMLENFLLITRQLSGDVSIPPRDGFVAEPGGSLGQFHSLRQQIRSSEVHCALSEVDASEVDCKD